MAMKCLLLIAFMAIPVLAQNARPAFEAASVKPNNSPTGNSQTHGSKGQVLMSNQTLQRLIERAYGVQSFQVVGPGWMSDVRFDIAAKYPEDTKPSDRPLMLRTLLEDRFRLAVHKEMKDLPGYELVVARGGFKLKPVDPAGGSDTNGSGGVVRTLTVKRTSMASLADLLSRYLNQMVVDKTGIEGVYDFEFKWTNADQSTAGKEEETVPSLFTAVEEVIGVHLKPQKVPTEIVVVEHVERAPADN